MSKERALYYRLMVEKEKKETNKTMSIKITSLENLKKRLQKEEYEHFLKDVIFLLAKPYKNKNIFNPIAFLDQRGELDNIKNKPLDDLTFSEVKALAHQYIHQFNDLERITVIREYLNLLEKSISKNHE